MKRIIFLIVMIPFFSVYAIKAITVDFKENPDNPEVAGILRVLDASQVTATLYADTIDASFYEIWMVERRGHDIRRSKIGYSKIEPDSTKVIITAIAKDSLNAVFSFVGISNGAARVGVMIPTDNRLLIGCDFDWKFDGNDTIPLVGYATGLPIKRNIGGQSYEGFYICGLRFSKVKPYDWKEVYGLSDYLYFEAVPTKEMDY